MIPQLHLGCISAASRLYLGCISAHLDADRVRVQAGGAVALQRGARAVAGDAALHVESLLGVEVGPRPRPVLVRARVAHLVTSRELPGTFLVQCWYAHASRT